MATGTVKGETGTTLVGPTVRQVDNNRFPGALQVILEGPDGKIYECFRIPDRTGEMLRLGGSLRQARVGPFTASNGQEMYQLYSFQLP